MLDVRARLNAAIRRARTLKALREAIVQLSADLEDAECADAAPTTDRAPAGYPAMLWEGDYAPNTPRESEAGKEYGI